MKEMCIQGVGISRLFEYQVSAELDNGALIQLLPSFHWGVQSIHAI